MSSEFVQAIRALGKEKGIDPEILFEAVKEAAPVETIEAVEPAAPVEAAEEMESIAPAETAEAAE